MFVHCVHSWLLNMYLPSSLPHHSMVHGVCGSQQLEVFASVPTNCCTYHPFNVLYMLHCNKVFYMATVPCTSNGTVPACTPFHCTEKHLYMMTNSHMYTCDDNVTSS